MFSFFSQPPVLNDFYQPIQSEHPAFVFYFTEIMRFLAEDDRYKGEDAGVSIFLALITKYLTHVKTPRPLVLMLKQKLEDNSQTSLERLNTAMAYLNQYQDSPAPEDEFIWLLSAICSVFPNVYALMTHPLIKPLLVIRDVNNIFMHTQLRPYVTSTLNSAYHRIDREDASIAVVTGQFEDYLRTRVASLASQESLDIADTLFLMPELVKYATSQQVETTLLPPLLAIIKRELAAGPDLGNIINVMENMPLCISKLSSAVIKEKVIPALQLLFLESKTNLFFTFEPSLQACIQRLGATDLYDHVYPLLATIKDTRTKLLTVKLLVAVANQQDEKKCDEISNHVTAILDDSEGAFSNKVLALLNENRQKNRYVNAALYQNVSQRAQHKAKEHQEEHEMMDIIYPAITDKIRESVARQVDKEYHIALAAAERKDIRRGTELFKQRHQQKLREFILHDVEGDIYDECATQMKTLAEKVRTTLQYEKSDAVDKKIEAMISTALGLDPALKAFLPLLNLKGSSTHFPDLSVNYVTRAQIDSLFLQIDFEQQTVLSDAIYKLLAQMAALPRDLFSTTQIEQVLQCLFRPTREACTIEKVKAMHAYLNNSELTISPEFLQTACQIALSKISSQDNLCSENSDYYALLASCALRMSPEAIAESILPSLDLSPNTLNESTYHNGIMPTLHHLIPKLNITTLLANVFQPIMQAFRNGSHHDLKSVDLLLAAVGPSCRQFYARELMTGLRTVDQQRAYIQARIYHENQRLYGAIPGYCNGEHYVVSTQHHSNCVLM